MSCCAQYVTHATLKGTHGELLRLNQLIAQERDTAVQQATLFRDYQIDCARKLYQLDHDSCLAEYTVWSLLFFIKTAHSHTQQPVRKGNTKGKDARIIGREKEKAP